MFWCPLSSGVLRKLAVAEALDSAVDGRLRFAQQAHCGFGAVVGVGCHELFFDT
jgi:hypothetical protein